MKSKKRLEKEKEELFVEECKKFYWNSSCSSPKDFFDDIKRFKTISKLFKKFHTHRSYDSLKENLIINHIIILKNVFGEDKISELLYSGIEEKYHDYLYTFLFHLKIKSYNFKTCKINERVNKKLFVYNYK